MRSLYGKLKINNYYFVIYYLYYSKKPKITKFAYDFFLTITQVVITKFDIQNHNLNK